MSKINNIQYQIRMMEYWINQEEDKEASRVINEFGNNKKIKVDLAMILASLFGCVKAERYLKLVGLEKCYIKKS